MTGTLFEIVHEDDELLVINKPADLVCHPTKGDEMSSLISRVRLHLGQAAAHMINRLARETTGIVLLAKRDEAAVELRRLWESGGVKKSYNALVHGHVEPDSGTIDEPLGCDEASPVAIKNCVRADGNRSRWPIDWKGRKASFRCYGFGHEQGASTRFGFTCHTLGTRSLATSCMDTTRTAISRWWRAALPASIGGHCDYHATRCTPANSCFIGATESGASRPSRMRGFPIFLWAEHPRLARRYFSTTQMLR